MRRPGISQGKNPTVSYTKNSEDSNKKLFSSATACPLVSRPRVNILEVPDLETKEEPKVQVQLDKKPLKEKKRKSEGFSKCNFS